MARPKRVDPNDPRPIWIQVLNIPEATKDYLYQEYLTGRITEETAPVDWGLFSDFADLYRKYKQSRVNPYDGQPVGLLQKDADRLSQDKYALQQAIATSDGQTVVFNGQSLSVDAAYSAYNEINNVESQMRDAIRAQMPEAPVGVELRKSNALASVDQARVNADLAFGRLQQEIVAGGGLSPKPFIDRYQATLDALTAAESKAVQVGALTARTTVTTPTATARVAARPVGPTVAAPPGARPRAGAAAPATGAPVARPQTAGGVRPLSRAERGETVTPVSVGAAGMTLQQFRDKQPPTAPTATATVTKAQVSLALANAGLADTPENRKTVRDALRRGEKVTSKTAPPSDDSFLDELAASFPAYADWSSANAIAYFGNDLIDVFRKINDGIYDTTTAEGRAGIQRAIEQTSYWRTTQASIKNWDQLAQPDRDKRVADQKALIASTFGDLGLDDATLTDLATIAQRTGLTDLGLRQQVYGRALAKPAGVGLDTRTLALESAAADNLRAVGRAYGYTPSTAELESALTGKPMAGTGTVVTEETIRQKAQKAAKGQYSWLSEQIDAGLTLDDIFTNYRNYAARTLQVDPSTIDFTTNPKWAVAFGDKQNGQLSLNEWTRRLKSDPQYGWQFTDEANKQVNSVVSTLERAFGLVK